MFWIRADGNAEIGAGHLMRCLTVADELKKAVGDTDRVKFICGDEASAALVKAHGHEAAVLGTDYRSMESELPAIKAVISSESEEKHGTGINKTSVILIDSYFVTDKYLEQMSCLGKTILMDDMQDRAFPVDAVVNYNAFADRWKYEKIYARTKTALFIGSDYIPIREQFTGCNYTVREKVRNVLITTGGGDADNIAGKILARLNGRSDIDEIQNNTRKLNYHLIIGQFNPNFEKMKGLSERFPWIHIHANVRDMASLMKGCDIAVTAGGTTIYELAAIGVPFICFSYAKNQELLTEYLGKNDIAGYGGKYHEDAQAVLENIEKLFDDISSHVSIRNKCYLNERELVDGKGAKRLAEGICNIIDEDER